MDPMTMLLISGAVEAGMGLYQGINAKRLGERFDAQKKADYRESLAPIQENRQLAEKQMRTGLNQETRNLYKSQFASDNARNIRAISEMGGQTSSVVGRILGLNTLRGAQTLSSMDAQAKERGQMQLMGVNREIAGVQRAQLQREMGREDMTMQQIAGLRQDSLKNVSGAFSGVAQGAMYNEYLKNLSGAGVDKKMPESLPNFFPKPFKPNTSLTNG